MVGLSSGLLVNDRDDTLANLEQFEASFPAVSNKLHNSVKPLDVGKYRLNVDPNRWVFFMNTRCNNHEHSLDMFMVDPFFQTNNVQVLQKWNLGRHRVRKFEKSDLALGGKDLAHELVEPLFEQVALCAQYAVLTGHIIESETASPATGFAGRRNLQWRGSNSLANLAKW